MWRYTYLISPVEGEKKTITILDKSGYDYKVGQRIKDMVDLFYNGHATWTLTKKEKVKA